MVSALGSRRPSSESARRLLDEPARDFLAFVQYSLLDLAFAAHDDALVIPLNTRVLHALATAMIGAEARGDVFVLRRTLQRVERGEINVCDAVRALSPGSRCRLIPCAR